MPGLSFGLMIWGLLFATPALADPCKAIPDKGPMPNWLYRGAQVSAGVNYVGDGDSFCLITAEDPRGWVEIRLSNFNAPELSESGGPEAKAALARLILHKPLVCTIEKQSYDRAVARCLLNGRDLGDQMRAAGFQEGGR